MDSELGRCLSDTLSPDPNVRIKAELRVNELTQHPGLSFFSYFVYLPLKTLLSLFVNSSETAITLASILAYDQVGLSLRQICISRYSPENSP